MPEPTTLPEQLRAIGTARNFYKGDDIERICEQAARKLEQQDALRKALQESLEVLTTYSTAKRLHRQKALITKITTLLNNDPS